MAGKRKDLKCLICKAPTIHAHMGIESCRACAVFYKRSIKLKYAFTCNEGSDDCSSGDKIIACRKCRFDRFKEIYDRASAGENEEALERSVDGSSVASVGTSIGSPKETPKSAQDDTPLVSPSPSCSVHTVDSQRTIEEPSFIDHSSYFSCEPSGSDTPILDKMKRAYSTLCLVRKSGEMSAIHHLVMHTNLKNEKMCFRPAKYTDMIPYSHIFFSGVMDFGKSAFPDFYELSNENKHFIVEANFQLIQSLDGSYRSHNNFPDNDAVMATYATYLNDETLHQFLDDCPPKVNKDEAIKQFRQNMRQTIQRAKQEFLRIKPSVEEFVTLFGLALWNDYTGNFDTTLMDLVKKNREAILKELRTVYIRKGLTEYAPRMGELLCLITNEERVLDLTHEHIQMYRMMNLFNEAYDDDKNDSEKMDQSE